jgi:hypothetical protein
MRVHGSFGQWTSSPGSLGVPQVVSGNQAEQLGRLWGQDERRGHRRPDLGRPRKRGRK